MVALASASTFSGSVVGTTKGALLEEIEIQEALQPAFQCLRLLRI